MDKINYVAKIINLLKENDYKLIAYNQGELCYSSEKEGRFWIEEHNAKQVYNKLYEIIKGAK